MKIFKCLWALLVFEIVCTVQPTVAQDVITDLVQSNEIDFPSTTRNGIRNAGYAVQGDDVRLINIVSHYKYRFGFAGIFPTFGPAISSERLCTINYNSSTNTIGEMEYLDIKFPSSKSIGFTLIPTSDSIIAITTTYNKKKKQDMIHACWYRLSTKTSGNVLIFATPRKLNHKVRYHKQSGTISCYVVDDSKKSAIMLTYCSFDLGLKPIVKKQTLRLGGFTRRDLARVTMVGSTVYCEKKVIAKKATLLKPAIYKNSYYCVVGKTLQKLDLNLKNTLASSMYLFADADGNMRVAGFYGDKRMFGEGIVLATLTGKGLDTNSIRFHSFSDLKFGEAILAANEENTANADATDSTKPSSKPSSKRTSKNKSKSSNEQKVAARNQKRDLLQVRTIDRFTSHSYNDDGELLLTAEDFQIFSSTTQQTTGSGSSSTTTTRTSISYRYGPGVLFAFNKNNDLVSYVKLNYYLNFPNYDPGIGIRPFVGHNKSAVITLYNNFYRIKLDNTSKKINSRKLGLASLSMDKSTRTKFRASALNTGFTNDLFTTNNKYLAFVVWKSKLHVRGVDL